MAATERLRDELRLLRLRRELERALGDMSRRFRVAGADRTSPRRVGGRGGGGTQDLERCAGCCRGRLLDRDLRRNGDGPAGFDFATVLGIGKGGNPFGVEAASDSAAGGGDGCIRFGGAHDDEDAANGWPWWV